MLTSAILALLASSRSLHKEYERHYPEWKSRRKTRGRQDASLRSRANRRKAKGRR